MEIISKQVDYSTEAGYAEAVALLTGAWAWDAVMPSEDGSYTDFIKYCDETETAFAGLRYAKRPSAAGHCFGALASNGTSTVLSILEPSSGSGGQYPHWYYLNIAASEDALCIHGSTAVMPYAAPGVLNTGVAKSTNALSDAAGYAAWHVYHNGSSAVIDNYFLAVLGEGHGGASHHHYHAEVDGRLMLAQKLVTPRSVDVPDSPLLIQTTTESHFNTCGYCTFGGKKYYKNGCILLPAE